MLEHESASVRSTPEVDLRKSKTHWTVSEKLRRLFWQVFGQPWLLMLPRPLHRLNGPILRLFGAQLGKKCLVMPGVKVLMPWNLKVGDYCAIGRQTELYNFAQIEIGDMSVISQYCFLCTGTHDITLSHMPLVYKPISISNQCWVAAGAFIGPGVTLGEGVVVGARGVVVRSVDAWVVVGGNPAKVLKRRVLVQ